MKHATHLEILLHERYMAVVAADGVVQTALVEVFLGRVQPTIGCRAFDWRVFAVQHDVIVYVDAVVNPGAAGPGVGALDYELVEHGLDDLGHRAHVALALDDAAAGGTCLAVGRVWGPGMLKALAAEVVLAGQLDGLVEGGVADQTHEIAVRGRRVLEGRHFGGHFEAFALATLRGW